MVITLLYYPEQLNKQIDRSERAVYRFVFSLYLQDVYYFKHPIRVVEQGNYHVIVVIECSWIHHLMMSMLFIPYIISEYPLS